jgi:hypothetical protein
MLYQIIVVNKRVGVKGRELKPYIDKYAVCAESVAEAIAVFKEERPAALVFNPEFSVEKMEQRCVVF